MSRKQSTKDPSGFVFDVQSNTVMAPGGTLENMKEKIGAVRAVVPNRSNNEIVLVLQHFDNCVARTVQAFMEGNASEVLKEWTVTGKKKNKKKKPKSKAPSVPSPSLPPSGKAVPAGSDPSGAWEKPGMNGFHVNGCAPDTESLDSLSEGMDGLGLDASPFPQQSLAWGTAPKGSPSTPPQSPHSSSRDLPPSESREEAPASPPGRKTGCSLERSLKDLQRCAVSLARHRALLCQGTDTHRARARLVFAELQSSLMDREVALLAEMDKVKAEAMEILVGRQRRAEALRKLTEGAARMSEEQLLELRADIKHFVSERKYDEELGRAGRFSCDLEGLKRSITCFGHVSHPKPSYSSRSRCSSGPSGPPPVPPGASPGSPAGPPESVLGDTGGRPRPPREPSRRIRRSGAAPGSGSALGSGSAPGSESRPPSPPRGAPPAPPPRPPPRRPRRGRPEGANS